MVVPPAATWILLAGEEIYRRCKYDQARINGKSMGLNLGRWALWKRSFGEIAMNQALDDTVKDTASRAASEIERIES